MRIIRAPWWRHRCTARPLGELKASGYRVPSRARGDAAQPARRASRAASAILPGIIGYDDTVIPEIENAILAGHHIVFLGERGQGKSRIIRGLVGLLDPVVPAVAGCAINDDPLAPICRACRRRARRRGRRARRSPGSRRDRRYGEKLATPDVSMADLVGEIDPVKVAEGRYLADEETIHYGLVPRTNRGIFAINELPDLTEKVQVGLFNLMEEKDVQIKGYKIRLPLDVVIVASANPEDYTSRGRIITPLKDRFDVQIRTHYPRTLEDEIAIMEQEVPHADRGGRARARAGVHEGDPGADHLRGARVERDQPVLRRERARDHQQLRERCSRTPRSARSARGEREIVPRLTDLHAVLASTVGQDRARVRRRGQEGERPRSTA